MHSFARTGLALRLVLGCMVTVLVCGCAKQNNSAYGFAQQSPPPGGSDDSSTSGNEASGMLSVPPVDDGSLSIAPTDGGGGGVEGSLVSPASLSFDPPSATIVVTVNPPNNAMTATANFTLNAVDANGNKTPVTPESIQFDRPDLASVTDTQPVVASSPPSPTASPYAGTGTIHALYGGLVATATLTVQVQLVAYDQGLSATSPAVMALGMQNLPADTATGISPILYPYDGTVWPLGLQSPLVMWNAPQAMDVYRLHYAETNYSVDFYSTLAVGPAQMRLDQAAWDRLTNSNGAAHGMSDPITFTLSRYNGQTAYLSATETWTVAPESLRGAIYFWSASRNATGGRINRFQPGPGAAPQILNTTGACAGCHAVNAQGTMLVTDIEDKTVAPSMAPYDNWSNTRAWASFDITQQQATPPRILQSTKFGADPALTPDGKYLVFGGPACASGGGMCTGATVPGSKYLSLGDPRTGNVIATSGLDSVVLDPAYSNLEMPAFSPDATMLALVASQWAGSNTQRDNVLPSIPEAIGYLTFDETAPSFNPTFHKIVDSTNAAFVTTGAALAYPSFTPDSKAVAFHSGTASTGCTPTNGCGDNSLDDGNLFLATVSGGAPIRLANASDPPGNSDLNASVEPTFNPSVRGGYAWVVFTSMRQWGNQPWPASLLALAKCADAPGTTTHAHCNAKRRLWLAAVDTKIGTVDPSHPAIYLEGQEPTDATQWTPNMRGFYTLAPCIPTATPGADGGMSVADAGATMSSPVPGPPPGTPCTAGFECCSGFCQNNMCVEPNSLSCAGLGAPCMTSGDCCNSPAIACINGVCAIPIRR